MCVTAFAVTTVWFSTHCLCLEAFSVDQTSRCILASLPIVLDAFHYDALIVTDTLCTYLLPVSVCLCDPQRTATGVQGPDYILA